MPSNTNNIEEELNETYRERADLFMLAMMLAKRLNYKIGIRDRKNKKYTILSITLPNNKEVSIHAKKEELLDEIMEIPDAEPWDGSDSSEKRRRIHEYIRSEMRESSEKN